MRRFGTYLLTAMLCVLSLASCSRKGRVIPENRMTDIYADMFLADQWLADFTKYRAKADTTLFYDPIFKKYGYDFDDYLASVDYYVDHPDKYLKLMNKAARKLEKLIPPIDVLLEKEKEYNMALLNSGYEESDFSTDSSRWHSPLVLWPSSDKDYVKGKDSLRTNTQPAFRELPGDKSLTPRREAMQF